MLKFLYLEPFSLSRLFVPQFYTYWKSNKKFDKALDLYGTKVK